MFIQKARGGSLSEEHCASICRLYQIDCHLFYYDAGASICYMGNFYYNSGGVLGTTTAPYYLHSDRFGSEPTFSMTSFHGQRFFSDFHDAMTATGGTGSSCPGVGYFTSFSWAFSRVGYGDNEYCRWLFRNPSGGPINVVFPNQQPTYGFHVRRLSVAAAPFALRTTFVVVYIQTEPCCDFIRIYAGVSDTDGVLLHQLSGIQNGWSATIYAHAIVITWTSDSSYNSATGGYYGISGYVYL